jgi:hypothetical protein
MKLTIINVLKQTEDGPIEIAYVKELKDTAIKHYINGKYVIEINGKQSEELYDSFEKAVEELETSPTARI